MQIRRFFAKDMRSALADVSRELGPDAAILSSRQIGGGVELLAAIDYDPSVLAAPASRSSREDDDSSDVPASAPSSRSALKRDSSTGARNTAARSVTRDWQRSAADESVQQTRSGKTSGFDRIADDLIARAALASRSGERVREPGNAGGRTEKISTAATGRIESPNPVQPPLPVGVEPQR